MESIYKAHLDFLATIPGMVVCAGCQLPFPYTAVRDVCINEIGPKMCKNCIKKAPGATCKECDDLLCEECLLLSEVCDDCLENYPDGETDHHPSANSP